MISVLSSALLCLAASPQEVITLHEDWSIAAETVEGERPAASDWRVAKVPGTFEEQLGSEFDGVAWYSRSIEHALVPGAKPARYMLEFLASATETTVYWNGEELGTHLGGWNGFKVELPADPNGGLAGELTVRVDEKSGHDTQGFLTIIQPHFGGIWQDVRLHVETGPTLREAGALLFGDGQNSQLLCRVPVDRWDAAEELDVRVEVRDGEQLIARLRASVPIDNYLVSTLEVPSPRLWAPGSPHLYDVSVQLLPRGSEEVLDAFERRVGFRHVDRDGTTLLWNGKPLQVRGMLHWGYSPPDFSPSPDPARWRKELEMIRSLGCNLVKCCLWVPPRSYYEIADEMGILVWQEYPTWHAQLTLDHLPQLSREFAAFFAGDRSFASVAFRSLTCETGADVDFEVLQTLYEDAHEAVPNSLVIDNSSWISWMRVHDFWDDHPYGNNGWWPGKLREFREFIAEREAQPLLFGECIASDTWFDREAWEEAHGDGGAWYEPWCFEAQVDFEALLADRWGANLVDELLPTSKRYALRNRKYQCERLRLDIPDAGYVLSVLRDFPKARMGFIDDLDRAKWGAEDWEWHRDVMLCLDTPGDRRALVGGESFELPVRVSNFGESKLEGELELQWLGSAGGASEKGSVSVDVGEVDPGVTLQVDLPEVSAPVKRVLLAELNGKNGERFATNRWEIWVHPKAPVDDSPVIRVVNELNVETLDFLQRGGRVLLRASPAPGSLKTSGIWYLKGAPWAPEHATNARVPRELLRDLQGFDLEQDFVLNGDFLLEHSDPILAFWDTHDVREVKPWLFVTEMGVGRGRLLVSALNHESDAGQWVESEWVRHLREGPAPKSALAPEVIQGLRGALTREEIALDTWRFRTDPEDAGRAAHWQSGAQVGDGWRDMPAGRHWEAEGVTYDGVAWYAIEVEIPESWEGRSIHLVCEGVDDSYHLYVNGQLVANYGDPETGETVWLVRTASDVSSAVECGSTNRVVLRVVDHTGAGGLHRPVFLATDWVDADGGGDLLN